MSSRLLYPLWLLSVLLVLIGSPLPASSPVMRVVGRLPVNDKGTALLRLYLAGPDSALRH